MVLGTQRNLHHSTETLLTLSCDLVSPVSRCQYCSFELYLCCACLYVICKCVLIVDPYKDYKQEELKHSSCWFMSN